MARSQRSRAPAGLRNPKPSETGRKAVLVTGGAGYVGSHACKALAASGYLPVSYDDLSFGHARAVRWGPFERGNLHDRTRLDEVIARYRPFAVIHLAAFAYVGESVSDPGRYYRNNVAGSLTLLEAMRDQALLKLVFSSTCAVYGIPDRVPIEEGFPLRPINPYGASKAMVERLLADFHAAHGLRYLALRYFNAAGADPAGEIGEQHDPETHLIPLVLETALGRREGIRVFGIDHATPDGTCIRDYVHVSDLADAHVAALKYLEAGGDSTTVNLGTGHGYSVFEVITAAERITGRKIPRIVSGARPGDPPRLVADPTRARQLIGWNPRLTNLDRILSTAWTWHQDRVRGRLHEHE